MSKARAANQRVFNRTGYRYILHRILESGYFTGIAQTPMDSAKSADFYETITLLSEQNAMNDE